jgi:hypothetical protein
MSARNPLKINAIKSIIQNIQTTVERLDKHKELKLTNADVFINLIYVQCELIFLKNLQEPYYDAEENWIEPDRFNPVEIDKAVNKILISLDLSKNKKFMRKLNRFRRYIKSPRKKLPIRLGQLRDKTIESLQNHLNENMNEIGKVLLAAPEDLLKLAHSMIAFLESSKKELMQGQKQPSKQEEEEEVE